MKAVREFSAGFVPTFGTPGKGRDYSTTPLGLEAPRGTIDSTAWVWQELLDDMVLYECNVNSEAVDNMYSAGCMSYHEIVYLSHRELPGTYAHNVITCGVQRGHRVPRRPDSGAIPGQLSWYIPVYMSWNIQRN